MGGRAEWLQGAEEVGCGGEVGNAPACAGA